MLSEKIITHVHKLNSSLKLLLKWHGADSGCYTCDLGKNIFKYTCTCHHPASNHKKSRMKNDYLNALQFFNVHDYFP